jgi:phosphoserine phosphatase RsbU/P
MRRDKVLVVEDDPTIRAILEHNLRRLFEVSLAQDGEEGLQKAKADCPDLIISDILMPKMDGFQLKDAIRKEPSLDLVPFIFLTSKGDEEARLQGLLTGADDYLVKPFHSEVLLKRARMLVDRARVYREDALAVFSQEVNSAFVPDEIPAIEGFDLFCKIRPATMGGGDFIDIVRIDNDNVFVLQGDVMGKGVKAKFFAYAFTGYFRGLVYAMLSLQTSLSPAQLVQRFSAMVDSDPFLQDIFITFFLFHLNVKDAVLDYCNAGYTSGLLVNHRDHHLRELQTGGGIPGFFGGGYEEERIELVPGDSLVLCSDGIYEAKNEEGIMLGNDPLQEMLLQQEDSSADVLGNSICELVDAYTRNALQYDDISISVVKKK